MARTASKDETWVVAADGEEVRITHPDKVLFPRAGVTKRDLVRYYQRVWDRLAPLLAGRPLVLHRFPNGVEASGFYQKRAPEERPKWVRTALLPSPTNDAPIEYVQGDNLATALWMVNIGAFEMNPWLALAARPEEPTHLVVDLDPEGGPFRDVCRAALYARDALREQGFAPTAKTSGKTGLHVMAPLPAGANFGAVRERLRRLGEELDGRHPDLFALEAHIAERRGRIYFDYDQNGYGSTIAAAWSVRPTPTATVSMPLTWEQVERGVDPASFRVGVVE